MTLRDPLQEAFYAVLAIAVLLGLWLDMPPPLIRVVALQTNAPDGVGKRVSPQWLRLLGWATLTVMTAGLLAMIFGILGWL
jgi:hypothetical protein